MIFVKLIIKAGGDDGMKTFKLKMLKIVNRKDKKFVHTDIPLLDGLIINREDEQNRWLIEAYIDKKHFDYFNDLYKKNKELMVQVKITKESNEPALFITSIIGVNEIDEPSMNVLLLGTIVDHEQQKVEELFTSLIGKGYEGKELLEQFKRLYRKKNL